MTPQTPYAPKMGSVVNFSRVVVPSKAEASLSVAVRVRPILKAEAARNNKRDGIVRVLDGKVVVVLDPDEAKDYLDQVQNRTKEKRYAFDVAYDLQASNSDVYAGSIQDLASGVSRGLNGTVFAYGSTGSGKTYTMVGTPADPGLMVLSLSQIFREKAALGQEEQDEDFAVTASYLEVYNEVIYDLLVKSSGPLELREDPDQGVCVAGLQRISVTSAAEIMGLLEEGNRRRKTDSTDANATSSRSHAVLEIVVRRSPRNQYRGSALIGKLTLVDLAGSERAAETNNIGQKLRDGANINKSLLALAKCINALGKQQKTGVAYVPYRNSKLTRLLKDSLQGNSRTTMVATISAAGDQYHHSVNTLKYADRAKEIKTHVVQNVASVERHVTDFQTIIDSLQGEVQSLKARLAERPRLQDAAGSSSSQDSGSPGSAAAAAAAAAAAGAGPNSSDSDLLAWIDGLAQEINENVEERINLQKALYELEDINVCNRYELQNIDDLLAAKGEHVHPDEAAEATERRGVLVEELADNAAEAERCRADIASNEAGRREIQGRIESAIDANSSANFLKVLSTFRIQAVRLQELKFQMAVRDQIISEQRDVISNLWSILEASGLTRQQVLDIARAEGIVMQGLEHEGATLASLPAGGGDQTCVSSISGTALPGAPAGMTQSLMAGKARFRYRFWQQYKDGHGADASSSGVASPLRALQSPVLLQDPPHSSRARGAAAAAGVGAAAAAAAAAAASASKVPRFPSLPSNAAGHVRAASPLRGWQPAPDEEQQLNQQQKQQQQQQPRGRSKQASANVTPEKARAVAAAAPGRDASHPLQQPQQVHHSGSSFLGGLKRFNLQAPAAVTAGSASSSSSHNLQQPRRHSLGAGVPSAAAAAGGSGKPPHSARRRQKGHRQRSSSSSTLAPHPGLPGQQQQQQQLASAITALRQHQQHAGAAAAGSAKPAARAAAGASAGSLQHQHSGMLAWQEKPQHGTEQQQQQRKTQQLTAVYGSPGPSAHDRLDKLRQLKRQAKAASAAVSAEPSQADLLPERSAASAYSSPATVPAAHGSSRAQQQQQHHQQGGGTAAVAALPAISEGAELRRRQQLQQLQMLQQHRASLAT